VNLKILVGILVRSFCFLHYSRFRNIFEIKNLEYKKKWNEYFRIYYRILIFFFLKHSFQNVFFIFF